jgi:hypothetical protein
MKRGRGGWTGKQKLMWLVGGAAGLHGCDGRQPLVAELLRRVGRWFLFRLHPGRRSKHCSLCIPASVPRRPRSSFGNMFPRIVLCSR